MTLATPVTAGSTILDAIPGDVLLTTTNMVQNSGNPTWGTNPYTISAISLNPTNLGQTLWTQSYNPPANNATRLYDQLDPTTNVFIMYDKESFQYSAYSVLNGNLVWGPVTTSAETALQYFQWSAINDGVVFNGNLYATGWGGISLRHQRHQRKSRMDLR